MAKLNDLNELQEDAQTHPNRGLIDGKMPFKDGNRKIDVTVTAEMYQEIYVYASTRGLPISSAASRLIDIGLSNPAERARTSERLSFKADLFNVSVPQLIVKILGAGKRKARNQTIEALQSKSDDNE